MEPIEFWKKTNISLLMIMTVILSNIISQDLGAQLLKNLEMENKNKFSWRLVIQFYL